MAIEEKRREGMREKGVERRGERIGEERGETSLFFPEWR